MIYVYLFHQTTGEVREFYIWECHVGPLTIADEFFTVGYKAIQHFAAVYLTLRIRKIKVTVLNDYRWSSIIVYTNSIIMVVLLITLSELRDYPNAFTFLVSACIFVGCTVFVTFSFVPKASVVECGIIV